MSVSKSFTAIGDGPELLVGNGESFEYDLSGTFVATLKVQQFEKGGWTELASLADEATGSLTIDAGNKAHARVRFRCAAFTSGTAVTILTPVAASVDLVVDTLTVNGAVNAPGLPDTDPEVAGQLYTDTGAVKVSEGEA